MKMLLLEEQHLSLPEVIIPPPKGITSPSEGATPLPECTIPPSAGTTPPIDEQHVFSEGRIPPPEDITPHPEGTTPVGTISLSRVTTPPP